MTSAIVVVPVVVIIVDIVIVMVPVLVVMIIMDSIVVMISVLFVVVIAMVIPRRGPIHVVHDAGSHPGPTAGIMRSHWHLIGGMRRRLARPRSCTHHPDTAENPDRNDPGEHYRQYRSNHF